MPIDIDVRSFAELNSNITDINGKVNSLQDMALNPVPAGSNNKIAVRRSPVWSIEGEEAYNGQFQELGNISGDVVLELNTTTSRTAIIATITGYTFVTSFGDNMLTSHVYTIFLKQNSIGNHSVRWPYGASILNMVGPDPNQITAVYVVKLPNGRIFVKCEAFQDTPDSGEVIAEIAWPKIYIPWDGELVYRTFNWTVDPVEYYGDVFTDGTIDWEVATDSSFSDLVLSSYSNPANDTVFPVEINDIGTIYFRCRYNGILDGVAQSSRWSSFSGEFGYFTDKTAFVRGNEGYPVTLVDGLAENVGVPVAGSSGGLFTINSDGSWNFYPNGDFDGLTSGQSANTYVLYTRTENGSSVQKTLAITVTPDTAPEFSPIHSYSFVSGFVDGGTIPLNLINVGLTNTDGYVKGNGYTQFAYCTLNQHIDAYFTYSVWVSRIVSFTQYQFLFGCQSLNTFNEGNHGWFISLVNNQLAQRSNIMYGTVEPAGVPFHVVLSFNSVLNLSKCYRNGVLVREGPLSIGTISSTYRNRFAIAGFSDFTSSYGAGARIHSVEIYNGELPQERVTTLYNKGMF